MANVARGEVETTNVDLLVFSVIFTSLLTHLQVAKLERIVTHMALTIFTTITTLLPLAFLILFACHTLSLVCTLLYPVNHLIRNGRLLPLIVHCLLLVCLLLLNF